LKKFRSPPWKRRPTPTKKAPRPSPPPRKLREDPEGVIPGNDDVFQWALMDVLSTEATSFLNKLAERFEPTRQALLKRREDVLKKIEAGQNPDFLPETKNVRDGNWTVGKIPNDLLSRTVEITGPVDRKMIINALNSGANVFMADFEDSHSPTWEATLQGQTNLYDAVRRTIDFTNPDGKKYALNKTTATLLVRPRGWHLVEKHFKVNGQPISASLFDFGLYFFPQRQRAACARHRPVFLSAENGEPLGSAALERRLQRGARCARASARHDQSDGAHRNDLGGF
jgi:malate synthase